MAGPMPPARTYSAYSTTSSPASYVPSNLNPNRSARSGSLRDTAYNGSEGHINDTDDSLALFDQDSQFVAPQSRAPTPPQQSRPAFGARVWSSISNAQPAAAALSRKSSVLHSRARSLAAYVPKLNASSTSLTSTSERVQAPNKLFGDLFHGESAPIRLGPPISPSKEKEETEFVMEYTSTLTERPGSTFRRRETSESTRNTPAQQQARKSSWFTRKPSQPTPTKPRHQEDELATLNINLSLFPNGPADPLNPSAFNDLLLNATNLLQRMQIAYKEKSEFITNLQPELDAQRDEVEEAETRSRHLKMQLEDMSRQAQEREKAMQDIAQLLAEEKMRVQELRENAARSIKLVRRDSTDGRATEVSGQEQQEDNETPTRRRKRSSNGSASDSGFESDLESVFSSSTSASGVQSPLSPHPISLVGDDRRHWPLHPHEMKDGTRVNTTALQRQSSSSTTASKSSAAGPAWATVEALRSENRDLKVQMAEMERELQGCIEFVGALEGM